MLQRSERRQVGAGTLLGQISSEQRLHRVCLFSGRQLIMLQMDVIASTDLVRNLCKKMAPPLVTLLSSEPEIQYVALRNINLIVQKRPSILAHEIKVGWRREPVATSVRCMLPLPCPSCAHINTMPADTLAAVTQL